MAIAIPIPAMSSCGSDMALEPAGSRPSGYRHRGPTHPGEMLIEEFLKPLDLPQATVAKNGISMNRLSAAS